MRRLIVIFLSVAVLAGAGFFGFKNHQKDKCAGWVRQAEQQISQGYYASAIEVLTLYFSNQHCRTKMDVHAISLLSDARPHVPLPDNAHLAQEMMLNKLGWSLKRDPAYYLPQAIAYLSGGKWLEAQKSADKAEGQQAALIFLAASIRLDDQENIQAAIEKLQAVGASSFVWAIVEQSLEARFPENETEYVLPPAVSNTWRDFAAGILTPSAADGALYLDDAGIRPLTGEDLTIAVSLLLAEDRPLDAIKVLEKSQNFLAAEQSTILAKLYWRTGLYHKLVYRFEPGNLEQERLLEVRLLKCLGEYALEGRCEFALDKQDVQKRYGRYSASVWGELSQSLSAQHFDTSSTVNAINRASELLSDVGPLFQLQSKLYEEIGEKELAASTFRKGELLSGNGPEWLLYPGEQQEDIGANVCDGFAEDFAITDLISIRECTEKADGITNDHVNAIKSASPDKAIYWRLMEARQLLVTAESDQVAKAIQILRPILKWAPDNAKAFQLLSIAYAYFDDLEAAYAHLATAVKLKPALTVEATRLALGFYQGGDKLSAKQLAHWWGAFTHIEMSRYSNSTEEELQNLIRERLLLLAQIAEEGEDNQLAFEVYVKLLETEAENHIVLNNLAYKLYEMNGDLNHALQLAEKAVSLAPAVEEYQATLSDIQRAIEATVS